MFYPYVIQSLSHPSYYYKGHCNDLKKRLAGHNALKTVSNKHKAPFVIAYYETFNSRIEAIKREKYWKTAAGRRYLQTVLKKVP